MARPSTITSYPPRVPSSQSSINLLQTLSAALTRDDITTQAGMTTDDLKASFTVIYQHLHEKHYLDRLIHALYLKTNGYIGGFERMTSGPSENDSRVLFVNRIDVIYPGPSELRSAITRARESTLDLSLLLLFLTDPLLRFRVCAIAHLLEAAFGLTNGRWEHRLRVLTSDEQEYVMQKLQDLFRELFQDPIAQASLRRFFSVISEWVTKNPSDAGTDEGRLPGLPSVVKEIFPCSDIVLQEILNIKEAGSKDVAFKSEIQMLLKFLVLSLRDKAFASAADWTAEGSTVIKNLQHSLHAGKFRGPIHRLIRIIVNVTDQLWEGGGATDTSLAIEKCLAMIIQKSLEGRDGPLSGLDPGTEAVAGLRSGWDVMGDFERLVFAVSNNIAPVPLPGIVWKRKSSEFSLDSAVVHFPHFDPNCIQLNSSMEFDKQTNKLRRRWSLKISGMEMEAKNVVYYFVSKSALLGRVVDVGEMSLTIPAKSLSIEIDFVLSPPILQRRAIPDLQESQDDLGRKHPIALAAHRALSQVTSPPTTAGRRRSISDTLTSRQGRRISESGAVSDVGRAVIRTGARLGQDISRNVADDAQSAFRVVTRVLYPNLLSSDYNQRLQQMEQGVTVWTPSTSRLTLGRPRRRLIYGTDIQDRENVFPATRTAVEMAAGTGTGTRASEATEREQQPGRTTTLNAAATASLSSTTAAYYNAFVRTAGEGQRVFLDVKNCRVGLRKLAVQVHETKHPVLQATLHPIMVRQLRKALEQTLRQAIQDFVKAINESAEQVMSYTQDELMRRRGVEPRTAQQRQQQSSQQQQQIQPSQLQQQQLRHFYVTPQPEPTMQGSDIVFAMPLFSTL
ncbi:hypothetical protein BGX28_003149 [Mortierella sp. GBA30]|nr:hypothetical protein BGX28_003149 [Mortierella sp. GBA30]